LWIGFVHSFLKLSKIDISERFEISLVIPWRRCFDQRKKIAKARMPTRMPSNGLETANQNETSQPEF